MRAILTDKTAAEVVGPFRGPLPFTESAEDRATFFGREKAVQSLLELCLSNKLVLVDGRSGAGKTSLISAGLITKLKARRLGIITVRLGHLRDTHSGNYDEKRHHTLSDYTIKALQGLDLPIRNASYSSFAQDSESKIWLYLYARQLSGEERRGCVIILDQFEEFFDLDPSVEPRPFLDDINSIVTGRPPKEIISAAERLLSEKNYDLSFREPLISLARGEAPFPIRFVISVREDLLPQVDQLSAYLPGIMRNTFRVRPLRADEAERAICDTLQSWNKGSQPQFKFDADAINAIISFLSDRSAFGTSVLEGRKYVDPTQLQILLDGLFKQFALGGKIIDTKPSSLERVLKGYYFKVLERFPKILPGPDARLSPALTNLLVFNFPRSSIASLCEEGLTLNAISRNIIPLRTVSQKYGVSQEFIDRLLSCRLVVASRSPSGERFLELAHDSLLPMLRAAKTQRRQHRLYSGAAAVALTLLSWHFFLANFVATTRWMPPVMRLAGLNYLYNTGRATGINLGGVDLRQAGDLSDINIEGVNLYGAYIKGGSNLVFKKSTLTALHMRYATLRNVDFDESHLDRIDARNAIWDGSDLEKTDFTNAQIINSTFQNTNLYEAKFLNVNASADEVNMSGSNWWMSRGWSAKDQDLFYKRGYTLADYANSVSFEKEHRLRCGDVLNSQSNAKADNLNGLAWFLVVEGGSLTVAASYLDEADKVATEQSSKNSIAETKAEIDMRRGDYASAERRYAAIERAGFFVKAWQYRHALARHLEDNKAPKPVISGYEPYYEHAVFELAAGFLVSQPRADTVICEIK